MPQQAHSRFTKIRRFSCIGFACLLSLSVGAQNISAPPGSNGTAPPTHMLGFGFSTEAKCDQVMAYALSFNGLVTDGSASVVVVAHNDHVAVAITCAQEGTNPLKRGMVVAASTDDATAGWFCEDITARAEQAAVSRPVTGKGGAAPTSGSFVAIATFHTQTPQTYNYAKSRMDGAYRGVGFTLTKTDESGVLGSGPRGAVAVALNVGVPQGGGPVTHHVIIAVSTDNAVATWYLNRFKSDIGSVPL